MHNWDQKQINMVNQLLEWDGVKTRLDEIHTYYKCETFGTIISFFAKGHNKAIFSTEIDPIDLRSYAEEKVGITKEAYHKLYKKMKVLERLNGL